MSNITTSTPYIAPGAPKSPLLLAVAGLLVAAATALAAKLGFALPVDGSTTAAVAGALAGLVGYVQHRMARREQAAGVAVLDETLAEALGETPPAPEAISESVERLRARAAGRPVPAPAPAPADPPSDGALWDAVGRSLRPPTAAEQLHGLDTSKPLGLDRWSGVALRRVLAGEARGVVGPITWEPGPAPGAVRVDIDGYTRMATVGDEISIARALGAEMWLEAQKNARPVLAGPLLEPEPDRPAARRHPPSNALLGDDGDPVSASDLDSGDDDERLDAEQAERIEAEVTARNGWDAEFASMFWRSKHAGLKAEIASANEDGVGSWLTFGLARRKHAERLLEDIVGAREAHGVYAKIWKSLTGKDLPPLDADADPDERTTERVTEVDP